MPTFALKAALADFDQLAARAAYLTSAGRPVRLELHTFGQRDVDNTAALQGAHLNIRRLKAEFPVESLVVHVPPQSVPVVTRTDFDTGQCQRSIAFAVEIGANAVVMHRYFGMVFADAPARARNREEAISGFEAIILDLARFAGDLRLLVENVGHYSLLPRDGLSYLTGPLDHFFPWEIAHFRDFLARENLTTVEPFVDVAHATLSANLFNRRRRHPRRTADDPRFAWITDDDLDHADRLHPFDFVDSGMPYLHVSDALQLDEAACRDPGLDEKTLTASIVSEGLELGAGNLPFPALPERFGMSGELVLEVEPASSETHVGNGAQLRSLETLAQIYEAP